MVWLRRVAVGIADTSDGTVRPVLRSRLWSASAEVDERHAVSTAWIAA